MKDLTEFEVDNSHCSLLTYHGCHFIVEDYQVG